MPSPPAASVASAAVLYERMAARLRMRHLHLVVALGSHAALGRAAEAIHVSQPAATQMLRETETLLGVQLFERHVRGMRPTEAGRRLVAQARTLLDSLRVAADELHAGALAGERALRVGAIPAASLSLLKPCMPALHAHAALRLHVVEDTTENLRAGLASGAFDVVLLRQPARLGAGLRFRALRRDRVVVMASARHPAAQRSRVRLADLAGSKWLLPPEMFAARQAIDAALRRARIAPVAYHIQVHSNTLVEDLLARGDVVAAAPRSILDGIARDKVVELKLSLRAPLEPLGALYRTEGSGVALRDFLDLLEAGVARCE